jgi:hypothetical protein
MKEMCGYVREKEDSEQARETEGLDRETGG